MAAAVAQTIVLVSFFFFIFFVPFNIEINDTYLFALQSLKYVHKSLTCELAVLYSFFV